MEKVCRTCKKAKPHSEFVRCKANKDGLFYRCKACTRVAYERNREDICAQERKRIRELKADGLHYVYILPETNWVGTTNYPKGRLARHKFDSGVTEMRIIYSTKNRDEALELEGLLHDIGYKGHESSKARYK